MSGKEHPPQTSLSTLADEYLSAIEQAVRNILATNVAIDTYAQVANGMPDPQPRDTNFYVNKWWAEDAPTTAPSSTARDLFESYKADSRIKDFQVDVETLERFQDAATGSSLFGFKLIEILAIICHDTGVELFDQVEGGLNKPMIAKPPRMIKRAGSKYPPFITPLSHRSYHDHVHYRHGWSETVGYWVEDRIFGGTVLFERGHSGTGYDGVFLNPIAGSEIFQLTESQLGAFVTFLTKRPEVHMDLDIPFKPDPNARLVHPRVSDQHNIYRDQYDRLAYGAPPINCRPRLSDEETALLYEQYKRAFGSPPQQ